jgi:hypothetical protein
MFFLIGGVGTVPDNDTVRCDTVPPGEGNVQQLLFIQELLNC